MSRKAIERVERWLGDLPDEDEVWMHGLNAVFVRELREVVRLAKALNDVHQMALRLYKAVSSGAGCCGETIGRGSRLRQVIDEIELLRRPKRRARK
jgi:hypothetical protein